MSDSILSRLTAELPPHPSYQVTCVIMTQDLKETIQLIGSLEATIDELTAERGRLEVIATKWCDRNHHDWDELTGIFTKAALKEKTK